MITRRLARPLAGLSSSSSSAWTCPSCQARSILSTRSTPILRPTTTIGAQQRRNLQVPTLSYEETFTRDGVPGLFSRTGYKIAWTTYQRMMVDKLNEQLAGEPVEYNDPKQLVLKFARDPMNASLFNHASMAVNNHFFFKGLSTTPVPLSRYVPLHDSLVGTFGSIETLRMTMIDTAQAMFGPGFVWLVWAQDVPAPHAAAHRTGDWRILTTYLAGTPFPEAGFRLQGQDMNTSNGPAAMNGVPVNAPGSFGSTSKFGRERANVPPGATRIMPALCVNTWEHVYIYDFGLPGKRKFLNDWWDAVDWSQVDANVPRNIHTPATSGYGARRH